MIKKVIIYLLLLSILASCAPKKEEYYNLTFEDTTIVVGYDQKDVITDNLHISDYSTSLNKKEEEIIDYLQIYVKDLSNTNIYLDGYQLTSIQNTCNDLGGEIISNNGKACVLHKNVKKHDEKENVVVLYGNILADNIDEIDRIEVYYK